MNMPQATYTSDPQKGQWGGHPKRNGRELLADITSEPGPANESWYRIRLTVRSTDRDRPLVGTVRFHLHPTFETPKEVAIDASEEARLELLAWGSFTAGAEVDEGRTKLELDLAELKDAPERFRLM